MMRTSAAWTIFRIFAILATLATTACQEPTSVQCPSGLVCPAGQGCAAHQDVCIKDLCGDGKTDPGEVCDDGNIKDGDGCSKNCKSLEVCGNGIVDTAVGEVCDDHNLIDGDGCSADCKSSEVCGNKIVDTAVGEVCDDGNHTNGDGCSHDCLSNETCGNGYTDTVKGEVCDDGNNDDADGCSSNCKSNESCGNGITDTAVAEVCDDGNHIDGDGCSANCKSNETCGNGVIDTTVGELCDPPGPACSADCRSGLGCGNGIRDPGEECDTGGTIDTTTCDMAPPDPQNCKLVRCGDGYANHVAGEDCDTSKVDTNLCNGLTCKTPACGDSYVNRAAGENCDTGGTTDTATCNMETLAAARRCQAAACGDGYANPNTVPPEDCDTSLIDTNMCNALTCKTPQCGDSYVNFAANEQCDSGGTTDTFCNMDPAATTVRCKFSTCGDGYENAATLEACDTSGVDVAVSGGFCNGGTCKLNICGDGYINVPANEQCDLGATTTDSALCNMGALAGVNRCRAPVCGDGYRNTVTEPCDEARSDNNHDCLPNCVVATCGDLFVDSLGTLHQEVCDDATRGQTVCPYGTANCFTCDTDCQGTTARTGAVCGDGIVNGPEACDDHNLTCGTCNNTCTLLQIGSATGTINAIRGNKLSDGETFTINDGVNAATVFEFNKSGGVAGGHVAVNVSSGDSDVTVAATMRSAINGVGAALRITASGTATTVALINDIPGGAGNQTLAETVADTSFTVAGMSGGGGYDCLVGAACNQDADCITSICSAGTCQAATLAAADVTPASLVAGATGNVDVDFTLTSLWPANGKVLVTFAAGFDVSALTTCTVSGADGTCTTSVAGQIVTITRGGAGTTSPGGTVVTVTLGGITNPDTSGLTGTFSIATQTSAGLALDSGSAPGVTITSGSLTSVSMTPASLVAGATSNNVVAFTLANAWPLNGKLVVTYPAGFGVSNLTSCSLTGANGTCSTSVVGQVVTVTRAGGAKTNKNTAVTVTLGGVTNPPVSGATGSFSLVTQQNNGTNIDTGVAAAVTIAAGSLSSVSVTPASLVAGATGNVAAVFTTANPWPGDGKMSVVFPAGFDVSGVNAVCTVSTTGTCAATVSSQTVTVTRSGGSSSSGAITVTLGGIKNPPVTGATGTFSVSTKNNASANIDTGTGAAVTITAGALTSVSVTPGSLTAGATGSVVVAFTTANPWPGDGKLSVVFPAGFVVTGVTTCTVSTTGTCAASGAGSTVTVTRSGGTPSSGAVTVTLGGITNPGVSGATGTFGVTTQNSGSTNIDTGTAPAVTLTSGGLSSLSVTPASLVAGASGNVTVAFTTANNWQNTGKALVVFPSGFNIAGVTTCTISNGTCTVTQSSQTVTVTRTGGGTITGGSAVTITVGPIVNPGVSGLTGSFTITTQTSAGSDIDTGSASGVTITTGALTSVTVTPASLSAGATGNVSVVFTTANPWPGDGKLSVVFPAAFVVTGVTTCTVSTTGTCTASGSSQTVTVTRSGGTPSSGAVTVTLGNITNPGVAGATGTFGLTTQTSASTNIDTGTAPAVTIVSGGLTSVSVTPASLVAGASGNVTAAFTTANNWLNTGKLVVVFPAGFNVAGVTTCTISTGTCTVTQSSQTVTVTRTGGGTITGGSAVTVTVGPIVNPGVSGTTGSYTVTTQTSAGGDIDTATAGGSVITAGALSATSVTPASLPAGNTGNVAVAFTNANPWPSNGKLSVTFPGGFDVSGVTCGAVTGANGTCSVSVASQVVTVTRTGGATNTASATAISVTLGNIQNPVVSGGTGTFALVTTTSASVNIDTGTAASVTITAGAMSSVTVTPASLIAGGTGNVAAAFTSANPWPADGKLVVTFPAGFDVSAVTCGTITGADGTCTVSPSGQVVTATRVLGATTTVKNTAISVTFGGIQNPQVSGNTTTFALATKTSGGVDIDTGTAPLVTIAAGDLSPVAVTPADLTADTVTTDDVTFTTANPWPATGKLVVVYPSGFDVSGATCDNVAGADGTCTVAVSSQTLTITRTGSPTTTPATIGVTVTLGSIKNPVANGPTGSFDVSTTTSGAAVIDQGTASGVTIP